MIRFAPLQALLLAGLLALGQNAKAAETVTIASGDWPPYCSENWPDHGIANQIVTEAFARVGLAVDYGFFPWTRAMKLARDGKWDGTTIWFDTQERRQSFYYSAPIISATNAFFYLKGSSFGWLDFHDLAKFKVGGTMEYSYGRSFDQAEAAGVFETQRSRTDKAGLENLLKGRIDVFPGELMVTYEEIRQHLTPEEAALITHDPRPISIAPLHLLLSRNVDGNDALMERFDEGLAKLRESGRYNEIVENAFDGYAGGQESGRNQRN
jgi:polar amino acid transport system substrate-binding protein